MGLEDLCNGTLGCNLTTHYAPQYGNETFRQALGFVLAVSSVMSTIENAIVFVVLIKYRVLHTPSNAILLSLAAANFLTGFCVSPLYALEWLGIIRARIKLVMATRESLIRIFFGITSITMAFISYDRYLHIRRLQHYKMSKKFLCMGLIICWFAPIAISSLYLPVVHFKRFAVYVEIVSMVFSLTILAAIIIPYGGILVVLRRHTNLLSGDLAARIAFTENQRRAGRTVAIIVTVYLLMNGPAIINEVIMYSYELDMICGFLVMANSSVNPIIYFYQTPTLKKHALICLGGNGRPGRSRGGTLEEEAGIMVITDSKSTNTNQSTL